MVPILSMLSKPPMDSLDFMDALTLAARPKVPARNAPWQWLSLSTPSILSSQIASWLLSQKFPLKTRLGAHPLQHHSRRNCRTVPTMGSSSVGPAWFDGRVSALR